MDSSEFRDALTALRKRCKAASIEFEDVKYEDDELLRIKIKDGRSSRTIGVSVIGRATDLLDSDFHEYSFVHGYESIVSYQHDIIEVGIRSTTGSVGRFGVRRILGLGSFATKVEPGPIEIRCPTDDRISLTLSQPSATFTAMTSRLSRPDFTLKIKGLEVKTNDQAKTAIHRIASSLLFQIDLLSGIPLVLMRPRSRLRKLNRRADSIRDQIQFPKSEFDEGPLSLYSYGRSASGLPLLQFLAFYQVVEFYFPTYSRAEAQRRVKAFIKDPTFRAERDSDISKLVSTAQVGKGSGLGSERAQLTAVILECVSADALRAFFDDDKERNEYYSGRPKYHKVPIANQAIDLREDVSKRLYDIRCKIVHTKNESDGTDLELLLPFTKEADDLLYDIELMQFVAHKVLVASSTLMTI